jgi:hypothetical protein
LLVSGLNKRDKSGSIPIFVDLLSKELKFWGEWQLPPSSEAVVFSYPV